MVKDAILDRVFLRYTPATKRNRADECHEILCNVENLMLIYGGGHKLLADTTLELMRGRRYGVVGRNGTGKTTLMNLIAS